MSTPRAISTALLFLGLQGCAAPLAAVLMDHELRRECPLHAYYDSFHRLERTSCATDEQWAAAVAREQHDEDVEDRVDCLRSGKCSLASAE